jgi:hypothetical protein
VPSDAQCWREQALLVLGASPGAARCASGSLELYRKLKRALLMREGQMHIPAVSVDSAPPLLRPARARGLRGFSVNRNRVQRLCTASDLT